MSEEPVFVNRQSIPTQVSDEQRKMIVVHPYAWYVPNKPPQGQTFFVRGEWFRRFVADGPPEVSQLSPFRDEVPTGTSFPTMVVSAPSVAAKPPVEVPSVAANPRALGGRFQGSGYVVRAGRIVGGPHNDRAIDEVMAEEESQPGGGLKATLGNAVADFLGHHEIACFEDFQSLSDDLLLTIPGLTPENLPAVREQVREYCARIGAMTRDDVGRPENQRRKKRVQKRPN